MLSKILFAVLLIGAISSVTTPVTVKPAAAVAVAFSVTDACELTCQDGSGTQQPADCPNGWHDAYDYGSDYNAMWYGGPHPGLPNHCVSGSCDEKHGLGSCSGGGIEHLASADVEVLRSALARNDRGSVRRIIAEHPNRIRINGTRSAIQLQNCTGDVVAHLPVSASLVSALLSD